MNSSWRLDEKNELNYLEVCKGAAFSDYVFNTFRRSEPLKLIVENSPFKSGLEYYNLIKSKFPWLSEYMKKFVKSDDYGNPIKYLFDGVEISPSTLRYIKTLGDLHHFFGSLDGMKITEIGGGYGGLCKLIHDVYSPASYSIFDLPEVLQLQKKFLSKFSISTLLYPEPVSKDSDLVIAMYSWSELSNELQIEYLEKVIKSARNCYIMLNYDIEFSYNLLKESFKGCDIKEYNLFYDDQNTEYAPYNRFIIVKCQQQN